MQKMKNRWKHSAMIKMNLFIVFVSIPILLMGSRNQFRNYESVFFTLFVLIWLKWFLEKKSE